MGFFGNFPKINLGSLEDSLDHRDRLLWRPWLPRSAVGHPRGPAGRCRHSPYPLEPDEPTVQRVPRIFSKFQEIQDFSRNPWFFKKIKLFQRFRYLGWSRAHSAIGLRGGRGSLGIGPQGRHNVLRHSGEAMGTIIIDRDGLESHQAFLN